jgi:DNA repair ATPase RecN
MNTKNSDKWINLLTKRIQSLTRKGNNGQTEQFVEKVNTLQSDLKAVMGLQKEIEELKDILKTKKKELAVGVAKLEKGRKKIKKDLIKERKNTAAVKKLEKQKEVIQANPDNKKGTKSKSGKTKVKLVKAKA